MIFTLVLILTTYYIEREGMKVTHLVTSNAYWCRSPTGVDLMDFSPSPLHLVYTQSNNDAHLKALEHWYNQGINGSRQSKYNLDLMWSSQG